MSRAAVLRASPCSFLGLVRERRRRAEMRLRLRWRSRAVATSTTATPAWLESCEVLEREQKQAR